MHECASKSDAEIRMAMAGWKQHAPGWIAGDLVLQQRVRERDWRDYVDRNRGPIHRDLATWCRKKDLLKFTHSKFEPSNYTGDKLKDPEIFIKFHYEIVIGRRSKISSEARRKLNQYRYTGNTEIRSYDLFVDIARNLDRSENNPKESVYVAKTEEP